ncbi:MAG: HDIG domain-containing protein [Verrucomicrobia bacterium]|nr:HDIG domain-containing protein [Verrucomicrobiota bacterium]
MADRLSLAFTRMFGSLNRKRLVKRGFACSKQRRKPTQKEWMRRLDSDFRVKIGIFGAFSAVLALLIFSGDYPDPAKYFLIGLLILATAVEQLWINHPDTFRRNSRIGLVFGVILFHLATAKLVMVLSEQPDGVSREFGTLLIPFALAPLVLSILLGKNHGIYGAIFVSLWTSILFRGIDPVLLITSLITGFIAVFATIQVRRRSRLIRAGVYVGLATWVLGMSFGIITVPWLPTGVSDWALFLKQSMTAILSGVISGMVVGGALPMLEALFQITTDMSWLEIADRNHPLLLRLSLEAPGTWHHSDVVADLAEVAANRIGANGTMCRACAYFHDIGKLVKPNYFSENIVGEDNPHDDLAPTMSALIIIAHVKEGVDLALKYGLNARIIDVIQQHHGTSLVAYFYKRALQQQQDAREGGKIMNIREEDIPEVREESFRYSGPKPQFKESGIISLADAVESASRSLEKPTPQKIEQLVNDIISKRVAESQLDECDLTLRELRQIAETFRFTLQNMLHTRIKYPKDEDKNDQDSRRLRHLPPASAA